MIQYSISMKMLTYHYQVIIMVLEIYIYALWIYPHAGALQQDQIHYHAIITNGYYLKCQPVINKK